ncbi:Mu transposase C-terminal domain-containing protein [Gottfriedia acidiceleris]|uniref:Mu transposase C-terminal domain-containing protein n=1 Tax=Gottfriedia acidiceleris TaxID=371036 RepID=A0ABY4JNV9_9BACI|nr:Mu transposase C-terminal domain-containing protein [Gottfriedia acidiceleris]UPM54533.1 Mu transposase C-terminal domain-containing protein [Gottfriedia acidiceleris]
MFVSNEIISFKGADGESFRERILWIDEDYVICYTINLNDNNALPIKRKISDLEQLLIEKILTSKNKDPYFYIYEQEEQIPERHKEIRDERWKIIETMCLMEPEVYEKSKRGSLIQQTVKNTGKSKKVIYDYLRQFWVRGKVKNTLLPDYRNSGNRGKERILNSNKTGRPRKFETIQGVGINVDEELKRIFNISIKKFYHTTKQNSLTVAYKLMIAEYFADDYRYENGVKLPILKDKGLLPTFRQFEYWYKKTYSNEEKIRKRKGDRRYELQHRAVLGTSVGVMYGPGTKFQIDATIADVYLVSKYNRNWIIGRPIIYVVIDVFSRMVTGLYVGLEGPSWLGACMALANAASDKVAYCKEFNIDIEPEEWNTNFLPRTLLADRGELEGYDVERIVNAFSINVENTPPYRADWKGIVEQHFRTINRKVKPFLPGEVVKDLRVRGDKDYRIEATLNLEEFTQIIIECVLYHNNSHWLKNYNCEEMMLTDEVKLIPREIWNWGIKNRSGFLRTFSEDIVKLHLLPGGNATVSFKGIEFKGMRYSCERAIKERWFNEARDRSWKVKVSYDPRNMNKIYIHVDDGNGYEICTLLEHQMKYKDLFLHDVEYLQLYEEYNAKSYASYELQEEVNLQAEISTIVNNAKSKMKNEKEQISNNKRIKGIRANRALEKEARRVEEAFILSNHEEESQLDTIHSDSLEDSNTKNHLNKMDLLRQKQKEMKEFAKRKSKLF